jgi:hypothetical protein
MSNFTEEQKGRIRLLVEALRSGQYKQGKERLHRVSPEGHHTWCCLGVACDVAIKSGLSVTTEFDAFPHEGDNVITYDGRVMFLPLSVWGWYGFDNRDPHAGDYSLTWWNDNGFSFEKIADEIEAEFLSNGD